MATEHYVVELNNDFSDDGAIAAKIAQIFLIDTRKANLLLSRAPGAITKPIPRAEAELIAAKLRKADLEVIIKKIKHEQDSGFSQSEENYLRDIPNNISLPQRQLLTYTESQQPSTLGKNKSLLKLRLLISSLVASLAIIALLLFFFLINANKFKLDEIQNWQSYLPLLLASIFALVVALPILYKNYKNYRNAS